MIRAPEPGPANTPLLVSGPGDRVHAVWSGGLAGQVYYSPGLWAMLGYEHTRMPSTLEAWQSLIHPDDLPLYRRRTESQLSGIASFIEPEYRVRARNGDWRWVYTRSKSVTLTVAPVSSMVVKP